VEREQFTDGELAALTLVGRQAAYADLMRRHRDPIFRLIRGYVGNADDALDLVQECFTSAYVNLHRYDQSRPLRAWLSRIAINKCRDWARRKAVRRFLLAAGSLTREVAEVPDLTPPADDTVADREELELLWQAIAKLPAALKEPLVLRTIEGLTQAETAEVLGISEKAVETRLYRARAKLAALRPS